jgi:type IV pilus assembly protein PilY1
MTRTGRRLLALWALALGAPLGARASDLDLLASSTPPNVMVIFDTSGSMQTVLFHDDYYTPSIDPDGAGPLEPLAPLQIFWPSVCGVSRTDEIADSEGACPGSTYLVGSAIDGDTDLTNDPCPMNDSPNTRSSGSTTSGCGGITLPNYAASGSTTWPENYLNWLLPRLLDADPTNDDFPQDVRLDAGKEVLAEVIDQINPNVVDDPNDSSPGYTENVRFGLSRFTSDNGGHVVHGISSGNKSSLLSTLSGVTSGGFTPLSETLVDIGRYFAGTDLLCDPSDGSPCYGRYNKRTDGSTTSTWSSVPQSPIDLSCRKNFVLFMTDGTPTRDLHDASYQSSFGEVIGNWDLDGNECDPEVGPQPRTCYQDPDDGRDDGRAYFSEGSDFLDDVAKFLYDYDFSAALAGVQNVVTYTLGFAIDHPLLSETAANGQGEYFTATSTSGLADTLQSAILEIIDRAGSFTAASVPSSRTSFDDAFYTAFFEPSPVEPLWEGHLQAFTLTQAGVVLDRSGAPAIDPGTNQFFEPRNPWWDAGVRLADANHPPRSLYTTLAGARAALADATEADLALAPGDLAAYPNYPGSGVTDTALLRTAVLDFLAGADAFDDDGDADKSERRAIVLGDIFHSNPVIVGPPSTFLLKEPGYGSSTTADAPFRSHWATRARVVYAGANDGMLHAFHAGDWTPGDNPATSPVESGYFTPGTGNELFGYVPGLLLDRVKLVPRNLNHPEYFVDGSPTVADAWLGDPSDPDDVTKTPEEWATVLVTGFREGGPGYLALDVTNPDAATASDSHGPYPKLLWEFTHPELAEAWSDPVITRVKVRGDTGSGDHCGKNDADGDCREQWVAIFGAGFAESGNPNGGGYDPAATEGRGVFVVNLATGAVLASLLHDPAATDGSERMRFAIPSMPAVLDLDFDGFADVVYVGDLGGQLWKWDLSAPGEDADSDGRIDSWDFGVFFDAGSEDMGGGTSHYRSIYFPPAASFVGGDLVLALGTGERDDLFYLGSASLDENNRFYVIADENPTGPSAFAAGTADESVLTDITGADADSDASDLGFFFRMDDSEKFVTNQLVFAGYVIAATYLPGGGATCDQTGSARLYVFDVATGQGFYFQAGLTTDDEARRITIGAGAPTDPRLSLSTQGQQLFIQTSTGDVVQVDPPDPGSLARTIYWRHVN